MSLQTGTSTNKEENPAGDVRLMLFVCTTLLLSSHTTRNLQPYVYSRTRSLCPRGFPVEKAHGPAREKSGVPPVVSAHWSSTRFPEKITGSRTWRCPRKSADSGTRDWPRGARVGRHLFRENCWDSNKDARRGERRKEGNILSASSKPSVPVPLHPPPDIFLVVVMEDSAGCSSPHETASLCLGVESTFYKKVSSRLTLLLIHKVIYLFTHFFILIF